MKGKRGDKSPEIFAVVDVETSGLRADRSRIIDIAVIRIENGIVAKRFSTLVNPGMPLSSTTYDICGITNEDVATAPPFEDVALEIEALCKDAVFVAHNVAFDYGFVRSEFRRIGMEFDHPTLCTVKLSRVLNPDHRKHDLDSLIARHGLVCDTRHRALPDAEVLVQYLKLLEGDPAAELAKSKQLKPKSSLNLHLLPDTPGIYFFYGENRELLYVGKSKNIRTRVRSHFSDHNYREAKLCRETYSVEAHETPGELSALLLESHTIKRDLPRFNRAGRKKSELVQAVIDADERGYKTISFGRYLNNAPDRNTMLFKNMPSARRTLEKIADDHDLCRKLIGAERGDRCFKSQIARCGACVGKEEVSDYNKRFDKAIAKRRMRMWPYEGGVMIEEKGKHDSGVVFLIKDWCLHGAYSYDGAFMSEFLPASSAFDYDTYKLLVRHVLSNSRNVKILKPHEFDRALNHGESSYEPVISYA